MINKYFTHNNIDKLERIINLIKPKFYNKLTWLVVLSGLTIISKPLWEVILSALLKKEFQLNITDEKDTLIGFLLVLIALTYNLITVYFDKFLINKKDTIKKKKQQKADKKLLKEFKKDLPTTHFSIEFLRDHDLHDTFILDNIRPLFRFVEKWNVSERIFLDDEIEKLKKDVIQRIMIFNNETGLKTYPQGSGVQSSIPDAYKNDFNLPSHVKESIKILNNTATDAYNAHQKFLKEAKEKLYV